jgi:hypothetical protein
MKVELQISSTQSSFFLFEMGNDPASIDAHNYLLTKIKNSKFTNG